MSVLWWYRVPMGLLVCASLAFTTCSSHGGYRAAAAGCVAGCAAASASACSARMSCGVTRLTQEPSVAPVRAWLNQLLQNNKNEVREE